MLTVQSSAGLYYAVRYDGTNGQAIADALQATEYSSRAGVITFKARIMRAGGLLTGGHRFTVLLGNWLVWADEGSPYVIAPPLTDEAFQQQYQTVATAGDITALQAQVDALDAQVVTLSGALLTLTDEFGNLSTDVSGLSTDVAGLSTDVSGLSTQVAALATGLSGVEDDVTALDGSVTAINTALGGKSNVGHTHAGPDVSSGILPYQRLAGTIAENATVVLFNRPTLVTPNTAADSWQWLYNGVRTVYGNEYNLLRVRGIPDFQVPVRFMSNVARDGSSTLAIMQVSLSDAASHLFQVMGNGDILGPGGASMLPTAPTAVTFVATGAANATTISDGVATGTPYPVTTTLVAADNRVYLDGSMVNNGAAPITAQTVLFNITSLHRPTAWVQPTGRTSTLLAARITIKNNGDVVLDQALAVGATITFGVSYRRS